MEDHQRIGRWMRKAMTDIGPYMVSHPNFNPKFKVWSHDDGAQMPWGVVRIEFRGEMAVFGSISPRGPHAADLMVQSGYRMAQQSCLRCHNMGPNGGRK